MNSFLCTKEKTRFLMLIVLLFFMVALMWSCVPVNGSIKKTEKRWNKPEFTQQEFAKDKYECIQQAQQTEYRAIGSSGIFQPGSASGTNVTNQNLFKLCMEARGWKEIAQEIISDDFTGKTTITYANGARYEGDFVNGKPQGKGTMTLPDGSKYEGDFFNDDLHGRGILSAPDGRKYEGDFVNGKRHGRGTYTCSNGKQFTGNFEKGNPIGFTINCDTEEQSNKPAIENSAIKPNNSSSTQPTSENSNKSEALYFHKLRDLKKLKDEGLITDKEYEQKRKAIIDAM